MAFRNWWISSSFSIDCTATWAYIVAYKLLEWRARDFHVNMDLQQQKQKTVNISILNAWEWEETIAVIGRNIKSIFMSASKLLIWEAFWLSTSDHKLSKVKSIDEKQFKLFNPIEMVFELNSEKEKKLPRKSDSWMMNKSFALCFCF